MNDSQLRLEGQLCDETTDTGAVTEENGLEFVNKILPKKNTWGGSEAIYTAMMIYKINVLMFNEYGRFYFPYGFDPSAQRIILLAYRLGDATKSKRKSPSNKYEHYDSVINIDSQNISFICDTLSEIIRKQNQS